MILHRSIFQILLNNLASLCWFTASKLSWHWFFEQDGRKLVGVKRTDEYSYEAFTCSEAHLLLTNFVSSVKRLNSYGENTKNLIPVLDNSLIAQFDLTVLDLAE